MKLSTIFAQIPGGSRLLQEPMPNLFFYNFSLLIGLAVAVIWIIYSPRWKVKRFSILFWMGLAASAIAGPVLGGFFR